MNKVAVYKFIFEDGYCIIARKLSKEEKRQEMFIHGRLVSVKKQYGKGG
jgi:hypothetical protein